MPSWPPRHEDFALAVNPNQPHPFTHTASAKAQSRTKEANKTQFYLGMCGEDTVEIVCVNRCWSLNAMRCSLPSRVPRRPPGLQVSRHASVHGLFQARSFPCSRASAWPRDGTPEPCFSCSGKWVLYHFVAWEKQSV